MKYLSIDIGGTFLKYAILNNGGQFLQKGEVPTPASFNSFLTAISLILSKFKNQIEGVSVSCPGKIDSKNGIVYFGGSLPYLHEMKLKDFIEEESGVQCIVINDGKSAAIAELKQGNLRNITNGAVIILGTGVGGGIILDEKLLEGENFQAGEFSFLLNNSKDVKLTTLMGKSGSAVEFVKAANEILDLSSDSSGEIVFEKLKKNDNIELKDLFQTYSKEIAYLISNLQVTLDLEKVLIGGGISRQLSLINEITRQYRILREAIPILNVNFQPLEIEACLFHNDANLLGSYHRLKEIIKTERNP